MTGPNSEALRIYRLLDAPVDEVFQAWVDPAELMSWFGPQGCVVDSVEADCSVGGRYSILMTIPGGSQVRHVGHYLEVDPPNRLVFTWILADQACEGDRGHHAETTVYLDLVAVGDKTELTLTHESLPDTGAVEAHRVGWSGSLDRLVASLLR